jgi:hypothetical protein
MEYSKQELLEQNQRLQQAFIHILDVAEHHIKTTVIPDSEGFANWALSYIEETLERESNFIPSVSSCLAI